MRRSTMKAALDFERGGDARRRPRTNPMDPIWAENRAIAIAAAEAFASALNATRGAPRARAWVPPRETMSPRVYIGGGDGYVEFHRFEPLLKDAAMRARGHFSRGALYPSQRAPFDTALKAFREGYVRPAMAKLDAERVAAGEARHKAVYDAIVAGASTTAAIAAATGIDPMDVFWTVQAMHAAGDVYARNLGSDREKIVA